MNRNDDLYLLNQRTERNTSLVVLGWLLCILAAVLSTQCGKTATPTPEPPKWPPPPAVVDALPVQMTPTLADAVTPAADPSPVTATL